MMGASCRGPRVWLMCCGVLVALIAAPGAAAAGLPALWVQPLSAPGTGINVAGPAAGGGVWFTGGELVGRVSDSGQVTSEPASSVNDPCSDGDLDAQPNYAAVGLDRGLWFMTGGPAIGSVDPSGSPVVRACSPFAGGLGSIAVGAEGDVWFTQAFGIARFTPRAGRVTMPIRSGRVRISYPQGVALGPDGSVWFGESGGPALNLPVGVTGSVPSYLARWRSGRVTAFAVSTRREPWSGPFDLVAGPDGRIWFATHFGVGASTPSGRIVFYTLNHGRGKAAYSHWVNGLAAAADGNIWFTQEPDVVGRVTPAGQVTRWHIGGGHPENIAPGSGLAVWITVPNSGLEDPYSLVRLTIPPKRCQVPGLRNRSLAAARRRASLAHCRIARVRTVRGSWRRSGVVVSQRPSAGAVRRPGQRIDVTLGPAPRRRTR